MDIQEYVANCVRTESVRDVRCVETPQIIEFCKQVGEIKKKLFYSGEGEGEGEDSRIIHGALGLISEAGEILEALGTEGGDNVGLMEEVGDAMWYVAIMLDELGGRGFGIGEVMGKNIEKLRTRYGEKFDEGRAEIRDLSAERVVLERDKEGPDLFADI